MPRDKAFEPSQVIKVGTVLKSETSQVRVAINVFDEKTFVDIRQWYKKKTDTEFNPGKGISLDVNALERLKRVVDKALALAKEKEVLDPKKVKEINDSFKSKKK